MRRREDEREEEAGRGRPASRPWKGKESLRSDARGEEAFSPPIVSHAEKLIFELQAELERVKIRLADFEQKHRMSFEEFQAHLHPESPPEAQLDCFEWSRWAERRRSLASELERAQRLRQHLHPVPPGGGEETGPGTSAKQRGRLLDAASPASSPWPAPASSPDLPEARGADWIQGLRPSRRLKRS